MRLRRKGQKADYGSDGKDSRRRQQGFSISQIECINPTGLLEEVMRLELISMREKTVALVREYLGPSATDEQVFFS